MFHSTLHHLSFALQTFLAKYVEYTLTTTMPTSHQQTKNMEIDDTYANTFAWKLSLIFSKFEISTNFRHDFVLCVSPIVTSVI